MKTKFRFFGRTISPACTYCENGEPGEAGVFCCRKNKQISDDGKCRAFVYNPLRRTPKSPLLLPTFSEEEFQL